LPGVDVVGFESAPQTDAQHQAVGEAEALLSNADNILALPAEAQCRLQDAETLVPQHERGAGSHADYQAYYAFECAQPARLDRLRLILFEQLPTLETVSLQWIFNEQQGAATLTPGSPTTSLSP
jgi:hypothetical protein